MKTYTLGSGSTEPTRRKQGWYVAAVAIVLAGYLYWTLGRPLPALQPAATDTPLSAQAPAGKLAWPAKGQAAVGVVDSPVLETHGKQTPTPTASTAKVITSLVILEKKPLRLGEPGPVLTLDANDVKLYRDYVAQDGSLVKVEAGERISEYQALQTIMLPSANNMADSLAIWAFGSLKNYSQAANDYLRQRGLQNTKVGSDASGLAPSSTSTAADLVKIGELAMRNPVLAEIAAQPTATGIPVVNNIKNVNQLLGTSNIIGIKTGNTDQAGGVFVSASRTTVNGKPVTIVTAVANAPGLWEAMHYSLPLVQSAQANFQPTTVVQKGTVVGRYEVPWGHDLPIVATDDLALNAWGGGTVTGQTRFKELPATSQAGSTAGSIVVPKSAFNNQLSVAAEIQTTPGQPSILWRLSHPLR
jgi:D-alanyl-D-alanine carboxypeptidase (penicillin-binding protein 5/6)